MTKLVNILLAIIGIMLFWCMVFWGIEKDAEYQEYRNEQICKLYDCGK